MKSRIFSLKASVALAGRQKSPAKEAAGQRKCVISRPDPGLLLAGGVHHGGGGAAHEGGDAEHALPGGDPLELAVEGLDDVAGLVEDLDFDRVVGAHDLGDVAVAGGEFDRFLSVEGDAEGLHGSVGLALHLDGQVVDEHLVLLAAGVEVDAEEHQGNQEADAETVAPVDHGPTPPL